MKRRKRTSQQSGTPKWMVTFSDMITLILVFFILLFSMSQIDLAKFESITESFQSRAILDFLPSDIPSENMNQGNTIGVMDVGMEEEKDKKKDEEKDEEKSEDSFSEELRKKADALERLVEQVDTFLMEEDLGDVISANRTEEGVSLVLQDSILFESAEADILDTGKPFLDEVGTLLKNIPNDVRVEGHTDTRPISNYRYPSNWELSGARAGSVVRYFIEEHQLDEARFLIGGYGDTRPVTKENNEDAWRENRRVEIVILDSATEQ